MEHVVNTPCRVGSFDIGADQPLTVIAGPCLLEDAGLHDEICGTVQAACGDLGLRYVFKASFDKANRSNIHSNRGPGLEKGLSELRRVGDQFGVPVTTDLHEPHQAKPVAAAVDLLQIPAFLCRQTDLLLACAETGKPVNVKKGQFLSPAEMKHVVNKLVEGGASNIMLTERGTFFGYHRLVNDFIGIGDMMELQRPVCFDVTHSTQLPGGDKQTSGGRPERAALLARAAVAAGVDAVFIECHPQPENGLSDASTMLRLDAVEPLLRDLAAIRDAVRAEASRTL